jgi:hypothetical protein
MDDTALIWGEVATLRETMSGHEHAQELARA